MLPLRDDDEELPIRRPSVVADRLGGGGLPRNDGRKGDSGLSSFPKDDGDALLPHCESRGDELPARVLLQFVGENVGLGSGLGPGERGLGAIIPSGLREDSRLRSVGRRATIGPTIFWNRVWCDCGDAAVMLILGVDSADCCWLPKYEDDSLTLSVFGEDVPSPG